MKARILKNQILALANVIWGAALLCSCSSKDFKDYNALGDLRILTIVADQPEVSPGTTVTFTPVLSDLNGGGRTLNYTVFGCIDPGVSVGVTPACSTADPTSIQSGTVTIAAGSSHTYTGAVSTFSLTMPSSATIFANQSASAQYNGVAYLVFYSVSSQDGTSTVNSFTRVIVSEASKATKNTNPVISSVTENDVAIGTSISIPAVTTSFGVTASAGSAETYLLESLGGSLISNTEQLTNTWFISDGSFEYQRSSVGSDNSWYPPATSSTSRGMIILVVTRDGRGGAAFQRIDMN